MEIFRIVDAKEMQVDSNGYPSKHVFLNELKCNSAVNALNAGKRWISLKATPPFYMQYSRPVWKDTHGIGGDSNA